MNMIYLLANVQCGEIVIDEIVPGTVSAFVTVLKIAVPLILIVLGMLDMAKAVMANEEKEMKEAQKRFIKRLIYAVLIFFVVFFVQFLFSQLGKADDEGRINGTTACIDCFINDNCTPSTSN